MEPLVQFEFTKEFLVTFREAVERKDDLIIKESLETVNHVNISEILEEFDSEESKYVLSLLNKQIGASIINDLDSDDRTRFLKVLEPEEIAAAFTQLEQSGKVRHFGVSNMNPGQIELLRKFVDQKIVANQLQLSLTNTGMIDSGINVNMKIDRSIDRDGGILEYCRLHDITIQPWSPFQYGFFDGVFLDNDKFPELNQVIDSLAEEKGVSNTAIAIAWLLRHPAKMQPIVGTTNASRVRAIAQASTIELTREEWYELYLAAGNTLP